MTLKNLRKNLRIDYFLHFVSKVVLIHGYGSHLTTPLFRPTFGPCSVFTAFREMIKNKEAAVFHWGLKRHVNLFQILNHLFLINHYEDEKLLAQSHETHKQLQNFFEQKKPEIIVCHSMGCFLLNNYLKNFVLPKSVRIVIFSQSDDIVFPKISESLNSCNFLIQNLYPPWDPTLLFSSIYNKKWRAGLRPTRQNKIKNIFFPLRLPVNLHTSAVRDRRLVDYVNKL